MCKEACLDNITRLLNLDFYLNKIINVDFSKKFEFKFNLISFIKLKMPH